MPTYDSGSMKRSKRTSGAENVKNELDSLNRRYMEMVKWTNERLKQIKATLANANIDVQVSQFNNIGLCVSVCGVCVCVRVCEHHTCVCLCLLVSTCK